jgi:hypothetical protein
LLSAGGCAEDIDDDAVAVAANGMKVFPHVAAMQAATLKALRLLFRKKCMLFTDITSMLETNGLYRRSIQILTCFP